MSKNVDVPLKFEQNFSGTSEEKLISIEPKPVYSFFKRTFDIIIAFVTLSVLIVPMLILALVIVIDSPGASPLYIQQRVGKNGKKFKFYKFRSMVPNADEMLEKNKKGEVAPRTAHSLNEVPFIIYSKNAYEVKEGSFGLANVAPTVAKIFGIEPYASWEESVIK